MSRELRKPAFAALTPDECRTVLGRNHVGRIAFLNDRIVDIEPVHYAAANSWIFLRSANGAKLDAFAHNPYVAFEVDEIESTFDWRSIVVHGTVYLISDDDSRVDHAELECALDALRLFIPSTLAENDPTPFRQTIYGVHIDAVTGRAAEQRRQSFEQRAVARASPTTRRRPKIPDGF